MRFLPLVVLALTLPVGAATWSVSGSFEPDTDADIEHGRMYADPHWDVSGMRVYFNVVPTDATVVGTEVNPNVGALRSRVLPATNLGMSAWLGIWKDCNRDGYIGHAESVLVEYRSELLLDDAVCPPGTPFNKFSWVSEFLYISPEGPGQGQTFPRVVRDTEVEVWGDFGRPENPAERHFDCAEPLARGALDSTGALLGSLDCRTSYAVGRAITENDGFLGIPPFDGEGGPYHPENDCDHPLNQHVGLYDNDPCAPDDPGLLVPDARPMASVWDCSTPGSANSVNVPYPFAPSQTWFGIGVPPTPQPGNVDPEGSPYATFDHAIAQCDRNPRTDGLGESFLMPDHAGTNPADPKRVVDFDFEWNEPFGSVGTTPYTLGVRSPEGAPWNAARTYRPPTYSGNLVRSSDLQGVASLWFTFYAYVGPSTLAVASVPTSTPGIYASEACADDEEGVRNGWDCDPAHWWSPEHGGVANPGAPRPHDLYVLRDTDCYDSALADGTPTQASLWILSAEPTCPPVGASALG